MNNLARNPAVEATAAQAANDDAEAGISPFMEMFATLANPLAI